MRAINFIIRFEYIYRFFQPHFQKFCMFQINTIKFVILITFLFTVSAVRVHFDPSADEYYPKLDEVKT